MAKRRLSERQKRRLKQRQSQTILDANHKSHSDNLNSNTVKTTETSPEITQENSHGIKKSERDLSPSDADISVYKGIVITNYGRQVLVEDTQAPFNRELCHLRANLDVSVSGDKVVWEKSPRDELGVITSIEPRQSILQRPDSYGKLKPVAANVSQMIITIAAEPEAHFHLIDRYLVAAENHGLKAKILLNKSDLLNEKHEAFITHLKTVYEKTLGYELLILSTLQTIDERLKCWLKSETSIFVGQSGVGKSSLVKQLLPNHELKIGPLSQAQTKGRHTTTHTSLYHFPWGGSCVDSPGIREFGMWHFDKHNIMQGFVDLSEHAQNCRFRDCTHEHEPGCGILSALENNQIFKERYHSYLRIINQLNDVEIKPNL